LDPAALAQVRRAMHETRPHEPRGDEGRDPRERDNHGTDTNERLAAAPPINARANSTANLTDRKIKPRRSCYVAGVSTSICWSRS